jgi:septal ring factor EnvC (AmiA/AmiB activator)
MRSGVRPADIAVALRLAPVVVGVALAAMPAWSAPISEAKLSREFAVVQEQSLGAAGTARERERALVRLQRDLVLLQRDAEGTQRGLQESRPEQEQFLGALEWLARNPPGSFPLAPQGPIDRARTRMLVAATVPALGAEAHALTREFARLAVLRTEVAKKEDELGQARAALVQDRDALAQLIRRRAELVRQLVREDKAGEKRLRTIGEQAGDLAQLIKQAAAGSEPDRHDKDGRRKAGKDKTALAADADPGRPKNLRVFDAAPGLLTAPVAGEVTRRFGEGATNGPDSQGLSFATIPGAVVVAPFDGRVEYAGLFRDYGLILIIRHGAAYHSVLAGLDRIDTVTGEWVLAGEPVGAMPESGTGDSGAVLRFELRRDGGPLDPLPLLAAAGNQQGRESGRGDSADDNRVRE